MGAGLGDERLAHQQTTTRWPKFPYELRQSDTHFPHGQSIGRISWLNQMVRVPIKTQGDSATMLRSKQPCPGTQCLSVVAVAVNPGLGRYGVRMAIIWRKRVSLDFPSPRIFPGHSCQRLRLGVSGLLLIALLSVTACSPSTDADTTANNSGEAVSEPITEPTVSLSESAVGAQATWVISVLNDSAPVAEAQVTEHLAEVMFDELSVDDFVQVFVQLRADQPWTVATVEESGDQAVVSLKGGSGTALEMSISLDSAGQINGLLFAPPSEDRTPSTSWEQVEEAVQALPASTNLEVTQITNSTETILMVGDDAAKPIGSMFKLYVLGAWRRSKLALWVGRPRSL